jgi:tetratricopeptide (TPR) repeat protein
MQERYLRHRAEELWKRAYGHQMAGELEEAIAFYKRSIDTYPTAEAFTFLGWAYATDKKLEEAIAECRRAIEVDPEFGNPWNDIGAYLMQLGRLDEAIPYLENATRAKRYESHSFPHFNLGRIYLKKGEPEKAVKCFRAAINANPTYVPAHNALQRLQRGLN